MKKGLIKYILVTTADELTWPKNKTAPVLFLGEWCKPFHHKEAWDKLNFKVAKYHWDDRKKLFNDYHEMHKIYEKFLRILALKLNSIHNVDYSTRYWRILIGPWLYSFIQIIFDRWGMIQYVSKEYSKLEAYTLSVDDELSHIPFNLKDFDYRNERDSWNQMIYQFLYKKVSIDCRPIKEKILVEPILSNERNQFTSKLLNLYSRIFWNNRDIFFISAYIGYKNLTKIQIFLRQFPTFWRRIVSPQVKANKKFRSWTISPDELSSDFSRIVCELIPMQIPTVYLEGYSDLVLEAQQNYPSRASAIFDSVSWNTDDVFKEWAGKMIEKKVKLYIGQHGGHYGAGLFNYSETHQKAISDKFVTWGWKNDEKIYPLGHFKKLGEKTRVSKSDKLLFVSYSLKRYSYELLSMPISSIQVNREIDNQFTFIESLPNDIRNKALIRLQRHNFGDGQKEKWKDKFPHLKYDNSSDWFKIITDCKLVVVTYNATVFLETFSLDIPTIMFWDPKYWELNEIAQSHYESLVAVGVLHYSPESAALMCSKVWHNPNEWWRSDRVRETIDSFKKIYARRLSNFPASFKELFEE